MCQQKCAKFGLFQFLNIVMRTRFSVLRSTERKCQLEILQPYVNNENTQR